MIPPTVCDCGHVLMRPGELAVIDEQGIHGIDYCPPEDLP